MLDPSAFTMIAPSRGWVSLKLGELWAFRELVYFLAWRDIKVRYKQTLLGAVWAVLQPFLTMVVFAVFFGKLAKVPSDGIPYPLFAFVALVPWQYFSNGLTGASNSLVGNAHLIRKVYFPRLAAPIAPLIAGLVDFTIAFGVLVVLLIWYGFWPAFSWLFLAPLCALAMLCSLGAGLWFSALNVNYRDVRFVIPFLAQLWMFLSPVAYPMSLVPPGWRHLYSLNPMAGVIEGFRWALVGRGGPPLAALAFSAIVTAALVASGALFFRRMEKTFADLV